MASNCTDRRVVVTGLGVVSSLGQKPLVFWDNILAGKCGIHKITSFDVSAFTCQIAAEVTDFDPTAAFPSDSGDGYIKTYAKCGEIPLLPQYYSPNSSPKLWSPDCHSITWSAGSNQFVYDLDTQKIHQSQSQ